MSRHVFLLLVLLLGSVDALAQQRKALIVSNRLGRADQPALRFTTNDGDRMAAVLSEIGGFSAVGAPIRDGSPQNVLAALEQLAKGPKFDLFLFYYSGHGDAGGLWMGESYFPTDQMLEAIRRVPAGVRVVVLDACQSGGAAQRKGVALAPPVEVRLDKLDSEGNVLVASSSVEEASFETDSSQGAVFTLHWVSGLRGAADEDDDGRVTLSEAYRYASAHTVQSTLLSSSGPQRPTFRWDLTGRSEPVLTTLGAAARLTVRSAGGGTYFFFDGDEDKLIAEIRLNTGQASRISLRPGRYVVKERTNREVRTARVQLAANDDRILDSGEMRGAPFIRLARKGAIARVALTLQGGPGLMALGPTSLLWVQAGVELQRNWSVFALEGKFVSGSTERNSLTVNQQGGGASLTWLPGFTLGLATVRMGPSVGFLALQQRVTAREPTFGVGILPAFRARLEVSVASALSLTISGEVGGFAAPFDGSWRVQLIGNGLVGLRFEL